MIDARCFAFAVLLPLATGCATAAAAPTKLSSASIDSALTHEKATAALAGIPETGSDCRVIALTAAPIGLQHLQDPNLQQTVGHARMATYGGTSSANGRVFEGTVLATIVGKQPSGELLTYHHIVFPEGTLRTHDDPVTITPTADKCIVNAEAKVNFQDGTGELAGLSGKGAAKATLNFCGGVGHAVVYGRLCKAPPGVSK